MQTRNPSDDELWDVCKTIPSDWEPYGQRRWHRKKEARPDCDTCRWFAELFRTSPDWGACANPESERAGLLTFREQGCWQHEPGKEHRYRAARPARCDFMRRFEAFLREQAASFIKEEVRKANDPLPDEETPAPTPEAIRETPLSVVVRRLLRHAEMDFLRPAFDGMAARASKDTRRYWEFARCYWARTVGVDISEIDLPEDMSELDEKFWGRVDATICEALGGRGSRAAKRKRTGTGLPTGTLAICIVLISDTHGLPP
jgi:hypothetical protein